MGRPSRAREWLAPAVVVVLYGLGLHPWPQPDVYDNMLYHRTSEAVASGAGYLYRGEVVLDWPPGMALLLSPVRLLGLDSMLWSKVVVVACAALALWLAHRLLTRIGAPYPTLAVLLAALSHRGLRAGTDVMAEWPYALASFAFLLALERRRDRSSWPVLAGLLLGAALTIRYTGAFLGAALLALAVAALVRRQPKQLWGPVATGAIGGALFLAAHTWVRSFVSAATPAAESLNTTASTYASFHPEAVLAAIGNLFFAGAESALSGVGAPSWLALVVGGLLGAPAVAGLLLRLRGNPITPSAWYVVALVAFLCFYEHGNPTTLSRYLMPVAPLLASYTLLTFARGFAWLRNGLDLGARRWARGLAGAWLAALLSLDAVLLVAGDLGRSHRGLSALVTSSAEEFYVGYWANVHSTSRGLHERPGDTFAMLGRGGYKYVEWFSGRTYVELDEQPDHVVAVEPAEVPEGFVVIDRHGTIQLSRRATTAQMESPRE